ncbi:MAG: hypothetical protein BAJATHORv1_90028 [Candidatus Thorarchaeota archaeon]|nr:MAG: hypothetical protein BAJATHORv1_90028 [Candidatus Thorarchaeota archaeon]
MHFCSILNGVTHAREESEISGIGNESFTPIICRSISLSELS